MSALSVGHLNTKYWDNMIIGAHLFLGWNENLLFYGSPCEKS